VLTKQDRDEWRVRCVEHPSYVQSIVPALLTALDEKDALIAELFGYVERIQWTDAEAANIEKLKARAEK
jgi:hypothetical protein